MKDIPLGKKSEFPESHDPNLLFPIPRQPRRHKIFGYDVWNAYELSWLDPHGRPTACMMEFICPLESRCIVESKSLKLYLGGISNTKFESSEEVRRTITRDLTEALDAPFVNIDILPLDVSTLEKPSGTCIDDCEIETSTYMKDASFLRTGPDKVHEVLYSDLLRSYCPITHQPDWGSAIIDYSGKEIDREGLLLYIISLRNHEGFAESCCEEIFDDIMERLRPEELTVTLRYTRRGGIDVNPVRSTKEITKAENRRLPRQ